jgi:hypothetical protein
MRSPASYCKLDISIFDKPLHLLVSAIESRASASFKGIVELLAGPLGCQVVFLFTFDQNARSASSSNPKVGALAAAFFGNAC